MGSSRLTKILFVSHEASRTGAPLSLLKIIKQVQMHGGFDARILIRTEGVLEKEFSALAPSETYYKKVVKKNFPERVFYNLFRGRRQAGIIRDFFELWRPDIAYINTVANPEIMELAHAYGVPVIVHVRELAGEIKSMDPKDIKRLLSIPAHYIANSQAVKNCLTDEFSIPPQNISHIHNFIEADALHGLSGEMPPALVKERLGIRAGAFIVGGAGKVTTRKGADFFIDAAHKTFSLLPEIPIYFMWVGGPLDEPFAKEMTERVRQGPFQDRIIFTGIQDNPYPYYKIFDILLITSREEPFGNTIIEAGFFGKPFICFEGSGGPEEFVKDGWGISISNFDTDIMAKKTGELLVDVKLRGAMGEAAMHTVKKYYTTERVIPHIVELINRFALGRQPHHLA